MRIPEPGVRFRIVSSHKNTMFCEGSGKTSVGGIQLGECGSKCDYSYSDGSWWTIEPSRVSGYYVLLHPTTNTRLYANKEREENGLISTEFYQYDDQLWLIRGDDSHSDDFQLVSYVDGQKLFLRDHANPHIGLCAGNTFNYPDQMFHFFLLK